MQEKILHLTSDLLELKTIPEEPRKLEAALERVASELKDYTIEHFDCDGVKSILIYNTETRPERFKLILNGHLDVIPGKEEQYQARIDGDKLYGVGSMDMKGNLAAAIQAFKDTAGSTTAPVALQIVTDEEIGGFKGTKHQIEQGVLADFVLSTEPTNFDIVNRAKGVLWLRITFVGTTAHGAYPWRGDNALWKAHEFLAEVRKQFPILKEQVWKTTLSLSSIATPNTAFNKIPDEAVISLDIRFIPEDQERVLETIQNLLPQDATLEVVANEPELNTSADDQYLRLLQKIAKEVTGKGILLRGAQGSSDARHFQRVAVPGIEFGPIGDGIGSDDEWVSISSLEHFYEILCRLIKEVEKL